MQVFMFQNPDGSIAVGFPVEPMIQDETPAGFMARMSPRVPPIMAETIQEYLARVQPLVPIVVGEMDAEYIARVEPQAPRKPAETIAEYIARVSPTIPLNEGETEDEYITRVSPLVQMIQEETDQQYIGRVSQLIPMKQGETMDQYLSRVELQYPRRLDETVDQYVARVSPEHPMIKAETEQEYMDRVANKALPAGAILLSHADPDALPPLEHQECWRLIDSTIGVDLDLYKAKKKARINALRDIAISTGQEVTYNGNVFDGDEAAQANVTKTLTACEQAGAVPAGFTWRSKDNKDIPFTLGDLQALGNLMFEFGDQQYAKSWQLKAQVDAATDIASVDAVTW